MSASNSFFEIRASGVGARSGFQSGLPERSSVTSTKSCPVAITRSMHSARIGVDSASASYTEVMP